MKKVSCGRKVVPFEVVHNKKKRKLFDVKDGVMCGCVSPVDKVFFHSHQGNHPSPLMCSSVSVPIVAESHHEAVTENFLGEMLLAAKREVDFSERKYCGSDVERQNTESPLVLIEVRIVVCRKILLEESWLASASQCSRCPSRHCEVIYITTQ